MYVYIFEMENSYNVSLLCWFWNYLHKMYVSWYNFAVVYHVLFSLAVKVWICCCILELTTLFHLSWMVMLDFLQRVSEKWSFFGECTCISCLLFSICTFRKVFHIQEITYDYVIFFFFFAENFRMHLLFSCVYISIKFWGVVAKMA